MSTLLAIDPGQAGGIAWTYDRKEVFASAMPATPKDIYDMLWLIFEQAPPSSIPPNSMCYLEKAGDYMPGNAGPAAVKFARHCGHLEMALIALRIPHIMILPSKWQQYFIGKPTYSKIPKEIQGKARKVILAKRKQERKNKIKAKAQGLYPYLKVTLSTADASGLLCYGMSL